MVAIVSGIRNGLNLTSAEVLGFKDVIGGNLQGRNGQGVNVNVALGQVVLQGQDDLLVGRGDDAPLVRTYDRSGNRTRDVSWGTRVATSGGEQVITGYDEDWNAIYASTPVAYAASPGYSTEEYRYDALNRLASVVRDGVQIDVRHYDGADRVIQSGPGGNLPLQYAEIINQGVAPGEMNGKEARVSRYDANGRLMHQTVLKSDNTTKLNISWDVNETASDLGITFRPDGYDAAGNVLGYTVTNHEAGVINKYTTSLARFDGYQASATHGQSTKQLPGDSTQQYDVNGYLVGVVDSTQPANNRTFVNDATGKALYVNQAGNVQRQLIVNGEVLGLYGAGVDPNRPASGYNNNPNFANIVDFDFGYARVSANYPSASPGAYTIRTGDTLQSISQSAYGDSALWYRIAEANGLASNSDLKVGQTLNVPNRVSTISNNSTTFKPYDPSQIEGDKTPSLATPQPKKKKGGLFGKLLMIIVAIVVSIFTAGVGAIVMSGGTLASATLGQIMVAGLGGITGSFGIGVAAAAGAAGSIASQAAGLATGTIDEFSWKGVALSAVSAGVTGGLGGGLANTVTGATNSAWLGAAVQGALGNALTQGVAVATGLQARFDWRGVAASAAGAAVGEAVGGAMGLNDKTFGTLGVGEQFGRRLLTGLAAGAATAVMRGGRVATQQVAVDAFGNALGESLASAASSDGTESAQRARPGQLGSGSFVLQKTEAALSPMLFASQDRSDAVGRTMLSQGLDIFTGGSGKTGGLALNFIGGAVGTKEEVLGAAYAGFGSLIAGTQAYDRRDGPWPLRAGAYNYTAGQKAEGALLADQGQSLVAESIALLQESPEIAHQMIADGKERIAQGGFEGARRGAVMYEALGALRPDLGGANLSSQESAWILGQSFGVRSNAAPGFQSDPVIFGAFIGSLALSGDADLTAAQVRGLMKLQDSKGLSYFHSAAALEIAAGSLGTVTGMSFAAGRRVLNSVANNVNSIAAMADVRSNPFMPERSPSRGAEVPPSAINRLAGGGPQIVANRLMGVGRESVVAVELSEQYPGANVWAERFLRMADGTRAIDPLTGTARRIDFVVVKDRAALDSIETTSFTADKSPQIAKENRIRALGGTFVRDPATRELIDLSNTPTRIIRRR